MQKKLLYITSRVFWPTKSGHEVHIYNYCKALKERYGYCIDIYILEDYKTVESSKSIKPEFIRNIFCGKKISILNIIVNLLGKTFLNKNHWPLQSSLYYSKANCKVIKKINNSEHYDVLFIDMIRLAPYIKPFEQLSALKVLDMGDLLSKRYKRQINSVNNNSNVGGAYTSEMSGVMQTLLKARPIQSMILRLEYRLMAKAEIYWAEKYDSIILVSTLETEELNNKLSHKKAVTVHVGVNNEYFVENINVNKENGYIAFVGDMRTSANSDTVKYIVENIMPLCQKIKQVKFIGKCPKNILQAYKSNEKIVFVGMVSDIRSEVKKTNVFLAPMAYGTGVKIKIIEAMAMGMPVVTNAIGAEGIPGVNGVHWYVGKTDQEIAKYVDELISNHDKCTEIGCNAQQLVKEHFSWEAATRAFEEAGL